MSIYDDLFDVPQIKAPQTFEKSPEYNIAGIPEPPRNPAAIPETTVPPQDPFMQPLPDQGEQLQLTGIRESPLDNPRADFSIQPPMGMTRVTGISDVWDGAPQTPDMGTGFHPVEAFERGVQKYVVAFPKSVFALASSAVGADDARDYWMSSWLKTMERVNELEPSVTFDEAFDSPKNAAVWLGENILEFLPQMASLAAGGGVGTLALKGATKSFVSHWAKGMVKKKAEGLVTKGISKQKAFTMAEKELAEMYAGRATTSAQISAMYAGSNYAEVLSTFGEDNVKSAIATGLGAGLISMFIGGKYQTIEKLMGRKTAVELAKAVRNTEITTVGKIVRQFAMTSPKAALEEMGQESLALGNVLINDPTLEKTADVLFKAYMDNISRPVQSAITVALAAGIPGTAVHFMSKKGTQMMGDHARKKAEQDMEKLYSKIETGEVGLPKAMNMLKTLLADPDHNPEVANRVKASVDSAFQRIFNPKIEKGEGVEISPQKPQKKFSLKTPVVNMSDQQLSSTISKSKYKSLQEVDDAINTLPAELADQGVDYADMPQNEKMVSLVRTRDAFANKLVRDVNKSLKNFVEQKIDVKNSELVRDTDNVLSEFYGLDSRSSVAPYFLVNKALPSTVDETTVPKLRNFFLDKWAVKNNVDNNGQFDAATAFKDSNATERQAKIEALVQMAQAEAASFHEQVTQFFGQSEITPQIEQLTNVASQINLTSAFSGTRVDNQIYQTVNTPDELVEFLRKNDMAAELGEKGIIGLRDMKTGKVIREIRGLEPFGYVGAVIRGFNLSRQITNGEIDFIGTEVNDANDIATACQVFRNPYYETLRAVFIKDGKIAGVEGKTSRSPIYVGLGKKHDLSDWINKKMNVYGADGYYLLHNHPGGDTLLSVADLNTTNSAMQATPGRCYGHLVINFNEYSFVGPEDIARLMPRGEIDSNAVPVETLEEMKRMLNKNLKKEIDPLRIPSIPRGDDLLGKYITDTNDLIRTGKILNQQTGDLGGGIFTMLVLQDNQINGIVDILADRLNYDINNKGIVETELRNLFTSMGAYSVYFYTGGKSTALFKKFPNLRNNLIDLTNKGFIFDAIFEGNESEPFISNLMKTSVKGAEERLEQYMGIEDTGAEAAALVSTTPPAPVALNKQAPMAQAMQSLKAEWEQPPAPKVRTVRRPTKTEINEFIDRTPFPVDEAVYPVSYIMAETAIVDRVFLGKDDISSEDFNQRLNLLYQTAELYPYMTRQWGIEEYVNSHPAINKQEFIQFLRSKNVLSRKTEKLSRIYEGIPKKFRNKFITLTHWSTDEKLDIIDPRFHGTGYAGEEFQSASSFEYIPRIYFGVPPYTKEPGLSGSTYIARVNGNTLYDLWENPNNYKSELEIYRAGYDGYYSSVSNAVAMFIPVAVQKIKHQNAAASIDMRHDNLTPVDISTNEFKRWFNWDWKRGKRGLKKSVVVNEDGSPRKVYHGSTMQFEKFDISRSEVGSHFGTPSQANARIGGYNIEGKEHVTGGAHVYPGYLSIINPLRLEDGSWSPPEVLRKIRESGIKLSEKFKKTEEDSTPLGEYDTKRLNKEIREILFDAGYDGVIYTNRFEGNLDFEKAKSIVEQEFPHENTNLIIHDIRSTGSDAEFLHLFPDAEDSYIIFDEAQFKSFFNRGSWLPIKKKIVEAPRRKTLVPRPVSVPVSPDRFTTPTGWDSIEKTIRKIKNPQYTKDALLQIAKEKQLATPRENTLTLAKWLVDNSIDAKPITVLTRLGHANASWYKESREAFEALVGKKEADTLIAIIAAVSPRAAVGSQNLYEAVAIYAELRKLAGKKQIKSLSDDVIADVVNRIIGDFPGKKVGAIAAIRNNHDMLGNKVVSFLKSFSSTPEKDITPAIDMWMFRSLGMTGFIYNAQKDRYSHTESPISPLLYYALANKISVVSSYAGMGIPVEGQAALWSVTRALWNKMGRPDWMAGMPKKSAWDALNSLTNRNIIEQHSYATALHRIARIPRAKLPKFEKQLIDTFKSIGITKADLLKIDGVEDVAGKYNIDLNKKIMSDVPESLYPTIREFTDMIDSMWSLHSNIGMQRKFMKKVQSDPASYLYSLQIAIEATNEFNDSAKYEMKESLQKDMLSQALTPMVLKRLAARFGLVYSKTFEAPGYWYDPSSKKVQENPSFIVNLSVPPDQKAAMEESIRTFSAIIGNTLHQSAIGFTQLAPVSDANPPAAYYLKTLSGETFSREQANRFAKAIGEIFPEDSVYLTGAESGMILSMNYFEGQWALSSEKFQSLANKAIRESGIEGEIQTPEVHGKLPLPQGDYYENTVAEKTETIGEPRSTFEGQIRNVGGPRAQYHADKLRDGALRVYEKYLTKEQFEALSESTTIGTINFWKGRDVSDLKLTQKAKKLPGGMVIQSPRRTILDSPHAEKYQQDVNRALQDGTILTKTGVPYTTKSGATLGAKQLTKRFGHEYEIIELPETTIKGKKTKQYGLKRIKIARDYQTPEEMVSQEPDILRRIMAITGQTRIDRLISEGEALSGQIESMERWAKELAKMEKWKALEDYKDTIKERKEKVKQNKILRNHVKSMLKYLKSIDTSKMDKAQRAPIQELINKVNLVDTKKATIARLVNLQRFLDANGTLIESLDKSLVNRLKILEKKSYKDLTVQELEDITNFVKHYVHLHDTKRKLWLGRKTRTFKEILDGSIQEMRPPKKIMDDLSPSTRQLHRKPVWELVKDFFGIRHDHFDLIIETLAGPNSMMDRVFYRNIKEGIGAERDLKWELLTTFNNMLKANISKKNMDKWFNEETKIGRWTWTRNERIAIYMHSLNSDNKKSLIEGGFGFRGKPGRVFLFTDLSIKDKKLRRAKANEEINAIVESVRNNKEEMAVVGAIQATYDRLGERLAQTYKEKNGIDLELVLDYYPMEVMRGPSKVATDAESEELLGPKNWIRIGIFKGMTKERVDHSNPILINPCTYDVAKSIHRGAAYVGLEIPLSTASQLLFNPQFRNEMESRYGRQVLIEVEKGLRDIAGEWTSPFTTDELLLRAKNKISTAILSGSPFVWFKQAVSLSTYMVYVDPKYIAQAFFDTMIHPVDLLKRHEYWSSELRERFQVGYERDVADVFKHNMIRSMYGGKKTAAEYAMTPIKAMDALAVVPGTQAAVYMALDQIKKGKLSKVVSQALDMTNEEASQLTAIEKMQRAYEFANWVTSRTQPIFSLEHRSSLSRGSTIEKMATMFSSATNQFFNLIRRTYREARRTGAKEDWARFAKAVFFVGVINTSMVMGIDFMRDLLYDRDIEKKDILMTGINNLSGLIYFVRDVMPNILNVSTGEGWYGRNISWPIMRVPELMISSGGNLGRIMLEPSRKKRDQAVDKFFDSTVSLALMAKFGLPYDTPKRVITSLGEKWEDQGWWVPTDVFTKSVKDPYAISIRSGKSQGEVRHMSDEVVVTGIR